MAWTTALTTVGIDTSVSAGSSIVGSGTANTKNGTWTELSASLANDIWGFVLQITYRTSNVLTDDYLIDIGIGGAGAETAILNNFLVSTISARGGIVEVFIPLAVAAGTRLSARCQQSSTSTADILGISAVLLDTSTQSGAATCETYGANTADSGGTSVDPGTTINTKGAWIQIAAATSADINWLVVAVGLAETGSRPSGNWLLDIGIGAAAAETVLLGDMTLGNSATTSNMLIRYVSVPIPNVAAGTRLSARLAATTNSATVRLLDVALYGFNVPQTSSGGTSPRGRPFVGALA